ncbi:MAG: GTP cyclohydrolase MptA [uncultured archaeon A07HB70]|nr:MAG: GTP cyclohydrolase MptA [uncultured archaeon A07HB70]
MARQLPDVQASRPDVTVGLSRVGVTDVEKLVEVPRDEGRPLVFTADFEVYVDLPGGRKGIDMSRNMQVIDETLEAVLADPDSRLEGVCGAAAERLLAKHDYTTTAQVRMEAELILRESAPESDLPTQHSVDVVAEATATEDGTHESIGVEVTGMTVCPCSQGMSESRAREVLADLGVDRATTDDFLDRVPQPGHSQRGHAFLAVGAEGSPSVDLHDLVRVARDSMSARIYNVAKRPDEDHMTFRSHSNARFVEDCVRALADGVVEEFGGLPDDAVVRMRQSNDESIHQHNAHAERELTMGQLRAETDGDAVMPEQSVDGDYPVEEGRWQANGTARPNGER